jgi:hypothetical protein
MNIRIAPRSTLRLAAATIAVLALAAPAAPAFAAGDVAAVSDSAACPVAAPTTIILSDPGALIRSRLDSEYLRDIASDWYPAVVVEIPDPASPAFILARLDSEYLRGIASTWYPELLACARPVA